MPGNKELLEFRRVRVDLCIFTTVTFDNIIIYYYLHGLRDIKIKKNIQFRDSFFFLLQLSYKNYYETLNATIILYIYIVQRDGVHEIGLKWLDASEGQIDYPQRDEYGDGDKSSLARSAQFGFSEELDVSADHQHRYGQQSQDAVQQNVVTDTVRYSEHVCLEKKKRQKLNVFIV